MVASVSARRRAVRLHMGRIDGEVFGDRRRRNQGGENALPNAEVAPAVEAIVDRRRFLRGGFVEQVGEGCRAWMLARQIDAGLAKCTVFRAPNDASSLPSIELEGVLVVDPERRVLVVLVEKAVAGHQHLDVGAHETAERVLRRAHDGLAAHIEAVLTTTGQARR